MAAPSPLVINDWTIFAHPLFLGQTEALTRYVDSLRQTGSDSFVSHRVSKRLAAIARLAFQVIPLDPTRPEYHPENTLGEKQRYWLQARVDERYRLFFRYHARSRVIVYAWVNDRDVRQTYEQDDNPYRIFRKMLENGQPELA